MVRTEIPFNKSSQATAVIKIWKGAFKANIPHYSYRMAAAGISNSSAVHRNWLNTGTACTRTVTLNFWLTGRYRAGLAD